MDLLFRAASAGDWPAIWPFWHRIVAAGETYAWDPDTDPDTDEPTARSLWMLAPARVFVGVRHRDAGLVGLNIMYRRL